MGWGVGENFLNIGLVHDQGEWRVGSKGQYGVGQEHMEALDVEMLDTLVQVRPVLSKFFYVYMGIGWYMTVLVACVAIKCKRGMYLKFDLKPAHASLGVELPVYLSIMEPLYIYKIIYIG